MTFKQLLAQRRSRILQRWLDLVLGTYPPETAGFLKDEKDRFANPVAHTIKCNLEPLLDCLVNGFTEGAVVPYLDEIVRIRAVQDFSPSQAVSFTWLLKDAIVGELKEKIVGEKMYSEWLKFGSRVDALSGLAFNAYVARKEAIYQIRIKELTAEGHTLMRMLGNSGA